MEIGHFGSALDKNATEMTVVDVYEIAAVVGQEFERMIDRYGCEALLRLMPKVVRILELLEVLVSRSTVSPEAEELRQELDRLRQERNDRHDKERKRQEVCDPLRETRHSAALTPRELELVEDMWRGEIQDLLTQISQLQSENNRLLTSLSIKDAPSAEQEPQNEEGRSEWEQQLTNKMRDMVNKQRHELCAKDHELSRRNEDVEALQAQQLRLMRINQDLRHRLATVESQGKAAIQQRTELEALAQARLQEVGSLQQQVSRLKAQCHHAREPETEMEVAGKELPAGKPPAETSHASTQTAALVAPPDPIRQNSLWAECGGGESGFLASVFESEKRCPLYTTSTDRRSQEEDSEKAEEVATGSLGWSCGGDEEPVEDTDGSGDESDKRFTLQELRDVLQERNELKAQVFMLEEELAYYKSEELEDGGGCFADDGAGPDPCSSPAAQPESGIRRLIFTAIMPMVAAGLIQDDPTLLPIRRLCSFV